MFIGKGYNSVFALANITGLLPAPFNTVEEKFVNPFTCPELLKIMETIKEEKFEKDSGKDKEIYFEDSALGFDDVYAAITGLWSSGEPAFNKTVLLPYYAFHKNSTSFGISETSENKEKALEFMYLIYTDKELADMLVYECQAE